MSTSPMLPRLSWRFWSRPFSTCWPRSARSTQKGTITTAQAGKLKEYAKRGELTVAVVELLLTEQKLPERKVTIKAEKISKYFPEDYSSEDMETVIMELLEEWNRKRMK